MDLFGYDNIQGGRLATEYLLNLGHTRIAYVGDEFVDHFGFYTSSERFEGYKRALGARGLAVDDELVWLGPHGYASAKHSPPACSPSLRNRPRSLP